MPTKTRAVVTAALAALVAGVLLYALVLLAAGLAGADIEDPAVVNASGFGFLAGAFLGARVTYRRVSQRP